MELQTFLADSAPEAVTQIRERLGPDAVVVNVRQLPAAGLSRFWQKPRIEVLAFRPEPPPVAPSLPEALSELRQELSSLKHIVETNEHQRAQTAAQGTPASFSPGPVGPYGDREGVAAGRSNGSAQRTPDDRLTPPSSRMDDHCSMTTNDFDPRAGVTGAHRSPWRVGAVLESTGLLPVHAQQVVEILTTRHGGAPPENLGHQIELAGKVLLERWRPSCDAGGQRAHLFVGPPGSGKTTCLCQWLTRTTLLEGKPARVWRLDGRTANNAESLSVYAEILGVPLERFAPEGPPSEDEQLFIDLPGVNWNEPKTVQELAEQVRRLPKSRIHLVLNSAYETPLLFGQIRAFSGLGISDLVFTHLDEEPRWGKLWNFVLGTNYTIGCLGAGQNVPGDFQFACPEPILNRQFPRK